MGYDVFVSMNRSVAMMAAAVIEEVEVELTIPSLKEQGNEFFRNSNFPAAIEVYSRGIELCVDESDMAQKSVLLTNRATCYFHTQEWDRSIADATSSLAIDPQYWKALYRRGVAHEQKGELGSALEDLEQLPDGMVDAKRFSSLRQRRDAQLEKEKEEMMASLKSLGNSILGKFGMSTDDFKFEKNPETGAYSINMKSGSSGS